VTPGALIPLSSAERARLTTYCDREVSEALQAHGGREERLNDWDRLYRAEPSSRRKSFPWDGSCNVVIPLIATTVDSILARIVNTIFSVDPFWTVRPLHRDFLHLAAPTQDFLDWSRRVEFNLYRPIKRWVNEVVKYGWGWLKPVWEVESRPYFTPALDGKPVRELLTRRGPNVYHVLVQDVITQVGIEDETQAEWLGQRFRLTDGQLWRRHADRIFPNRADVEKVLARKEDASAVHDALDATRNREGMQPVEKLNTLYELHADVALGTDHVPVSGVYTWHHETKTILRAIYNPDFYGKRPLIKGEFVSYEGRQEAFGICRMLGDLQEEITTVHQQQVDNATLANTRFFVGKRGQVRPGTKVYPGRFLTVGDPERDIKVLQLGDIYSSMRALEVSILAFAERRSGVTDYQLGRESNVLGSRATATGTLAIIQEGNRRFDLNVRDMRDTLSDLGKMLLQLNQQFRPKGLAYFVQGEDGLLTEQTLDLPIEYIEHKMGVELTASTATINRDVERQGLMALVQMLTQNMQLGQQAAMVVNNPQVPGAVREYTAQSFEGLTTLMRRVCETFNQKDVDALVPILMEEADGVDPGIAQGGGAGPAPAFPPGGGHGVGALPGLAS